jgi:hypothetical protein
MAPQWGVGNSLHRVLDVIFHDNLMRLRTEHGPKNLAMNPIHHAPGKASMKAAGWDQDYLQALPS